MQPYSQYQPTGFDRRGAFLPERQNWLVLPLIQTRNSGCLELSNFATALDQLGGESDTVEVHRFGHWGPGWYEIILVAPNSKAASVAEEIEAALESYPVLDESDFSEREWARASDYWASCSVRERVELCQRYRCNIFSARHDYLPQDDNGSLFQALAGD